MRLRCFINRALAGSAVLLLAGAVSAIERTSVFDVPGMNCALCPITVRKAIEKVPGVASVKVSYTPKQAVVTYDDARANAAAIIAAAAAAGYPVTVKTTQ